MGITAAGVRRHFGQVRAVDGVDLVAEPGKVTALIGPNGAGKTTLLLVLAGLLAPDEGSVRIAGFDPVTEPEFARAATGWMPDAFGTWDSLTAREVLTTFASAYRLTTAHARSRADELLDLVHLTEFATQPAAVLSRGQKQRLGLARALIHDPQVLLLDEPAAGLDPRSRIELRLLLRSLAAQGKTVLVSSHVLTELDELADDATFISRGRSVTADVLTAAESEGRQWRLRALDGAHLERWLVENQVPFDSERSPDNGHQPASSVLVRLGDDRAAAALLHDAVTAGVPVTSLAPAGGALEQTYLALDEERR